MLQFIETICYENGGFQRVLLHEERMNRTRLHFFGLHDWLSLEDVLAGSFAVFLAETLAAEANYSVVADLPSVFPGFSSFAGVELQSAPNQTYGEKFKCRITYSETIENIEFEPYTPKVIQSLQLVYDDIIDFGYKYRDRSALNSLLDKRGAADEILIVKNGLITDTSYSNVVFLRDVKWYTPETPLLTGTRRADYLHRKLIFPLDISPEEIGQFEEVRLINAMLSLEEAMPIKTDFIYN